MKWSPCPRIVTPDLSIYQKVLFCSKATLFTPRIVVWVEPVLLVALTVTTLRQRLLQPDIQPAGASQLHPRHKHLLMKRSLRCRVSTAQGFYRSASYKIFGFFKNITRLSCFCWSSEMWTQPEQAGVQPDFNQVQNPAGGCVSVSVSPSTSPGGESLSLLSSSLNTCWVLILEWNKTTCPGI